MWHPRHHPVVATLAALLLALTAVRYLARPTLTPTSGSSPSPQGLRLDPNTAPLADLEALPGMGTARAQALLTYRQARARSDDTTGDPTPLFRTPADLAPIPGFGPETLARLTPYLHFPDASGN